MSRYRNIGCCVNWEEYFRLKDHENLTDKQIAKIFMMGINTLRRLKKEKKIETNKYIIQVDWNKYFEYKKEGLTDKVAAKLMDLNPSTLSQKKKERGLI